MALIKHRCLVSVYLDEEEFDEVRSIAKMNDRPTYWVFYQAYKMARERLLDGKFRESKDEEKARHHVRH